MSLICRHREVRARHNTTASTERPSGRNQHRHVMTSGARCLCLFSTGHAANSLICPILDGSVAAIIIVRRTRRPQMQDLMTDLRAGRYVAPAVRVLPDIARSAQIPIAWRVAPPPRRQRAVSSLQLFGRQPPACGSTEMGRRCEKSTRADISPATLRPSCGCFEAKKKPPTGAASPHS